MCGRLCVCVSVPLLCATHGDGRTRTNYQAQLAAEYALRLGEHRLAGERERETRERERDGRIVRLWRRRAASDSICDYDARSRSPVNRVVTARWRHFTVPTTPRFYGDYTSRLFVEKCVVRLSGFIEMYSRILDGLGVSICMVFGRFSGKLRWVTGFRDKEVE